MNSIFMTLKNIQNEVIEGRLWPALGSADAVINALISDSPPFRPLSAVPASDSFF